MLKKYSTVYLMNIIINRFSKWAAIIVSFVALSLSCSSRHNTMPVYGGWSLDSLKKEVLSNPNNVAAVYDSMMTIIGAASDKVSREYQLYLLFAKVRTDKLGLNDSLSGVILDDFSTSSDPLLRSLSYYIDGRAHLEMGATEFALKEFYKAIDVDGVKAYPKQCLRVCLMMSYIYAQKGLYRLALTQKFEVAKYAKQDGDYKFLSHSYREIASMYEFISQIDSASFYFKKAFDVGNKYNNKRAVYYTNLEYVRFLLSNDSLFKAKQIMDTIPIPQSSKAQSSYYGDKLRCLYLDNKYDSCVYYCELVKKLPVPEGRLMAFGYEYQSGRSTNNIAAALEALEQYTALCDSLFDIHKVEDIRMMRNKYDFLLGEKEKEVVEKRFVLTVSSIVIVALLVVFILYSLIQQQRLRNIKRLEIMQARLKLRHIQYERSTQSLQDKKQEVEDLKRQLNDMVNKESSSGRELTKLRKRLAELTVRLKSIEMTSSQLEEKSFKESPAYLKIVHAITFQKYADLTIEDWTAFQEGCQVAFPTLYAAVSGFSFSMKTVELKICYLTKLGIAPTEISRLIFKSPSAVSKCKTRIYAKLMNCHGRTADFDELMLSL